MTTWAGVVLALTQPGEDEMDSRLPTALHPVLGRPLVWHSVSALAAADPPPQSIVVVSRDELSPDFFHDIPATVRILGLPADGLPGVAQTIQGEAVERLAVVDAGSALLGPALGRLLQSPNGRWLAAQDQGACAVCVAPGSIGELFTSDRPLRLPSAAASADGRIESSGEGLVVRRRADLALAIAGIRNRIVQRHMANGVTVLLPESVLIDVDVRIGRDSMLYPSVVLEGQTSIGEETVVGPGCRIVDSWVGSGVELKGWNFIANTSVRNRAILEPYVRRGYD